MKKQNVLIILAVTIWMVLTASAAMAVEPTLDFNASDPASGVDSVNWKSLTADSSRDWTFAEGAGVTLEDVTSSLPEVTKSYRFTGLGGDSATSWYGYAYGADSVFEIVVKPADTGESNQTIFESGAAGVGVAIWYTVGTEGDGTGTISFTIDSGTPYDTVSAEIDTTDFHHVVMVLDYDSDSAGTDLLKIYIDGVLVGQSGERTDLTTYGGGDAAALGYNTGGTQNGASSGMFTGDLSVFRYYENTAPSDAEVFQKYFHEFSPSDGAIVPAGDVTLEWVNMDPNTNDASSTYVDVWFGTDSDKTSGNYTKIVSGAQDMTSFTVTSPGPGIYYWQVDSYLNGDPLTVDYSTGNEPNIVEGAVFMFSNDSSPSVTVADMVTLYGLPTQLIADVVDDGSSELTYSWTAPSVLPNGLEISFDANDVADPIVTFTKVPYTNANIANASFEEGGSNPGWTMTGSGDTGAYTPGNDMYGGIAPDGDYLLWLNKGVSASQVLSETVQDGATYTLSSVIGFDSRWNVSSIYTVQLIAGSGEDEVVLAEDSAFIDDPNNYYPSVVTYTIDPVADADKIGLPLQIRLTCDPNSLINAFFDNVVLTSDPEFIPTKSSVELTVDVQDATNPAVSDSITVEIYDDGCAAARDGLGLGLNYAVDFDGNCVIGLEDLGTLTVKWLYNQALDAPVVDAQATYVSVPNGDFESMYKPGTRITGSIEPGGWSQGVGSECPIESNFYNFEDGTTGTVADIPGWLGYDREGWVADGGTGTRDQTTGNLQTAVARQANHTPDGAHCIVANGGSWGNPAGGLVVSEVTLGTANSGNYTLSVFVVKNGAGAQPVVLDLLADGQVVSPSSSVIPVLSGEWQELIKIYEPNDIDPSSIEKHIGKALKIVVGVGRGATGTQTRFDDVTLSNEITDADLPSVDLGAGMISSAGQSVELNPTVTNNDTQAPQRALSYAWTAYPSDSVTLSDPASPNPTVTFISPGKVVLDLAVTLEGAGVVSDSVIYEVYEDACQAAQIIDPSMDYDLTDINGDCITNLVDFATLAADWMVDYTLTEAAAK